MIWTASIGSSSGPQAFHFLIFAICFFTSSNEKHSTGPSVVGNSSSCSLGFSALKSLSTFCFHLSLIFPDSVKMVPCSSLAYAMSDISLLLLSLLLASLYIIFAPSLVSSLVYNSSYASSFAIATALFAALLASLYAQCCSSLLSFWYALNASSLALVARRVSSFHHTLSFSL